MASLLQDIIACDIVLVAKHVRVAKSLLWAHIIVLQAMMPCIYVAIYIDWSINKTVYDLWQNSSACLDIHVRLYGDHTLMVINLLT